jgi:hypothetical protein
MNWADNAQALWAIVSQDPASLGIVVICFIGIAFGGLLAGLCARRDENHAADWDEAGDTQAPELHESRAAALRREREAQVRRNLASVGQGRRSAPIAPTVAPITTREQQERRRVRGGVLQLLCNDCLAGQCCEHPSCVLQLHRGAPVLKPSYDGRKQQADAQA